MRVVVSMGRGSDAFRVGFLRVLPDGLERMFRGMAKHFGVLFYRQHVRQLAGHPFLFGLNLLGIALGVAVFLAIQIANRSATEGFRAGIEMVTGKANLEIRGEVPEAVFPLVAELDGVVAATPVVEGVLAVAGHPGETIRVLGMDPFTGTGLRAFELLGANRETFDLEAWLREPDALAVSKKFEADILPRFGGEVPVLVGGRTRILRPTYVIEPADAATLADPRLVAMDIGWAQELLGTPGVVSSVLLLVEPSQRAAIIEEIRGMVPDSVRVEAPARRSEQVESMLGAFQLNLTALSLVSMLVGVFLIYNTVSASVVRRQVEIGILRSVGTSRAEVRGLFLGEALVAGVLGSGLGIAGALPLAGALMAPVAQTISSLYLATSIERLFIAPWQIGLALLLGCGASLVAAWVPASEAANCEPARVLHPGSARDRYDRVPGRWLGMGAVALAVAWLCGWAALEFRLAPLGFASAFFVLAGFSLLVPASIQALAGVLRLAPGLWRLAVQNFARSVHRNSVTVAALAAAIAMTVGVSVMIHSFRQSVDDWIGATLVADLFIGSAANEVAAVQAVLPGAAVDWVCGHRDVEQLATFVERVVEFRGERAALAVVSGGRVEDTRFIGGERERKFDAFLRADQVAISEPFANRFDLGEGDRILLPTPEGEREFGVAGVYQDYARNGGVVLMTEENFLRYWPPVGVQSMGITLREGSDVEAFADAFRQAFPETGQFSIYSNRELRERIFEIFDQTFAITLVLRAISVLVAAVGVLLALWILTTERQRETGVLRAVGASRGQVIGVMLREAALIGVVASVVGVASGACLAMVLTWVVNKAYFGWTIQLGYPAGLLASTPLWIIPVAVVAALIPAWRAARLAPAVALRCE